MMCGCEYGEKCSKVSVCFMQDRVAEEKHDLEATIVELRERLARADALFIHVYNTGYNAGHNDTVEGQYTHVLPVDLDTYHSDVVGELLAELGKGEAQ